MLVFYLVCAAAGSIGSFVLGGAGTSVGASGAVFGLFGLLLAAGRVHHPVDRQSRALVSQLGMLIVINLLFGFAVQGIDNAAHLGGLVAGLWLGALIPPTHVQTLASLWQQGGRGEDAPTWPRSRVYATVIAIGVVAIVVIAGLLIGTAALGGLNRLGDLAAMFATLLGSLPRPPLADDAAPEALLDAVLELQVEHGLEPLTDAGWALDRDDPVAAWRATAARTDGLVKAVVDGPFTSGRPAAEAAGARWSASLTPVAAGSRSTSRRATGIGADADARARFVDAHAHADGRARRRRPPVPRDHRRQRGRRGHRHGPRGRLCQPGAGPHRRTRQLATRDDVAGRTWASSAARSRRGRAATTARSCCCGQPGTRPRPVGVARRGSGWPRPGPWPRCRGRWPREKVRRLGEAARLAAAPAR